MILAWKQQLPWPELAHTPWHPESCLAHPSRPESGADRIIAALWGKCGAPAGAGTAAARKVTELLMKPGPAKVPGLGRGAQGAAELGLGAWLSS